MTQAAPLLPGGIPIPRRVDKRRFYVAWHPEYPTGVLRMKDAAGLAEWQRRTWFRFHGAKATITEVTALLPAFRQQVYAIPGGVDTCWVFRPSDSSLMVVIARGGCPDDGICLSSGGYTATETVNAMLKRGETPTPVTIQRCDFCQSR